MTASAFLAHVHVDVVTPPYCIAAPPVMKGLLNDNHHFDFDDANPQEEEEWMILPDKSRRQAFSTALTWTTILIFSKEPSWAADPATTTTAMTDGSSSSPFDGFKSQLQTTAVAESTKLDVGLLESRVSENVLSPPSYGMEAPDIFYPSWFQGTWQVSSTTREIVAPCGIPLFGGNATYERARNDIGTTLNYESRFISDNHGGGGHNNNNIIIADREYNVAAIAKAALGQYSVIDIPVATPNKLTCILVPKGSPTMLRVDLIALNRRQETISDIRFDCSEVTREIISPVVSNNNNNNIIAQSSPPMATTAPILKEVETTSLYTFNPAKNEIQCQQRSATYLLPSQTSPIAYKMWEAARGRPIDTRFYDVRYTKTSS